MVKKETIGKIQLILGIILLVGVIIGGIYSYNSIKEQMETKSQALDYNALSLKSTNFSDELKTTITLGYINLNFATNFGYTNMLVTLECSAVIIALLSIIMILQGLANRGDAK